MKLTPITFFKIIAELSSKKKSSLRIFCDPFTFIL